MRQLLPGDRPGPPTEDRPAGPDISTRQRILAATAEVLGRYGTSKLSLSEASSLPAHERLDAALQVIVDKQLSYPGLRMVDIEPDQVIQADGAGTTADA